jgi:hypothetical protein
MLATVKGTEFVKRTEFVKQTEFIVDTYGNQGRAGESVSGC